MSSVRVDKEVVEYRKNPNCWADLWAKDSSMTEEEQILFIYRINFLLSTFTTSVGSKWDTAKPVRTSMPISSEHGKGTGVLTGRWEEHTLNEEKQCMVEVAHDFGADYIFEQFISQ